MSIHALTERSSLPFIQLAPKQYVYARALHHGLQACPMFYVLHFWQPVSLLEVCCIRELFIVPTSTRSHFEASSVSCIVMVCVYLSHI